MDIHEVYLDNWNIHYSGLKSRVNFPDITTDHQLQCCAIIKFIKNEY